MATMLKFLKGTQENYDALTEKDEGTFYYTEKNLYLGDFLLTSEADTADLMEKVLQNTEDIESLIEKIGELDDLDTAAKTTIVAAINETYEKVLDVEKEDAIEIEEDSSDNYAKVYTITQGGEIIGTINIPKDLVVESGDVEVNPSGQEEGTYIVLTLANTDNQKIYINVQDLVDIYTAAQNATQVQLTVSGTEISAKLVAGGVGTSELADDAVTTDKITDANVTKSKLSVSVQESLDKADVAEENSKAYADELFNEVETELNKDLKDLAYEDEETDGEFVTSVSQKDGLISVTKSKLFWGDFE